MPEGDTIFRAARTLDRALAGRTVTRFDSVFSKLARANDDLRMAGRTIERVDARGKHLLIWFSGDLVLRTHMRMHGSWHIYRPGERWQRPRADMRIVIGTAEYEAVAFSVPVAELTTARDLERDSAVRDLGPDILADGFDAADAVSRIQAMTEAEIAEALRCQPASPTRPTKR
ncbi:MAG TPA: DNA-formamidopyrimidine glycosylase family protein [Vicinamibacterales bacterium]|nr:DNA-formamidopyrimidine glycosylase family protein [Vicinamibacterales bacterium]